MVDEPPNFKLWSLGDNDLLKTGGLINKLQLLKKKLISYM
jgi:hypothetical protein